MALDPPIIVQHARSSHRQCVLFATHPGHDAGRQFGKRALRMLGALALSASLITGCSGPFPQQPTPVQPTPVQPTERPILPPPLTDAELYEMSRTAIVLVQAQFPANPIVPEEGLGTGSGVVIEYEGQRFILTAAHVVEGATSIAIRAPGSDQDRPARVVASSTCDDLALLQVDNMDGLEPAPLGQSGRLLTGGRVVLLGYPLNVHIGGAQPSFIAGSVSQVDRQYAHLLSVVQHDAESDGGYSGGPLINTFGEVVGIHVMRVGQGVRFAVSSDHVKTLLGGLASGKSPNNLGLYLEQLELENGEQSLVVLGVKAGSSAATAELRPADVLLGMEGTLVPSLEEYCRILRSRGDGEAVRLEMLRLSTNPPVALESTLWINRSDGTTTVIDPPVPVPDPTPEPSSGPLYTGPFTDDEINTARDLSRRLFAQMNELLFETFQEPSSRERWTETADGEQSAQLRNNVYELSVQQPNRSFWYWWWSPEANQFPTLTGNYLLEVDVALPTGTGAVGVAFGVKENGDGAVFRITADRWELATWMGGSSENAYSSGFLPSDAIRGGGQVNQLRMLQLDGVVYLFINDTLVGIARDFPLNSGYVGIDVKANDQAPVTVLADNFRVRQLP